MREVWGEVCERNSIKNSERAAARGNSSLFGARIRTLVCRQNMRGTGADGLKLMPGESATKLERFGAKYVSERLLKTAKKVVARGENVPTRGENSHLLSARGRGRMADAEGGSQAHQISQK